jgi:hypothetical protein
MANAGAKRLVRSGQHEAERHFPSGAAQTRIVSLARIRLNPRNSVRHFKGIICGDISEFESSLLSHAVRSPPLTAHAQVSSRSGTIDVLSMHVPGREGTRKWLNAGRLATMILSAPDRWRVNPSGRDLTQETWMVRAVDAIQRVLAA